MKEIVVGVAVELANMLLFIYPYIIALIITIFTGSDSYSRCSSEIEKNLHGIGTCMFLFTLCYIISQY